MRALVMMPNCPKPPRTAKKSTSRLLASGTSDDLPLACDHFQLQYAADLRTVVESLSTHACVGESATHSDVEIIGPGIGCQSLLQRGLQHIHPELPAACFHERECTILVPVWHHLYNPLDCGHLYHDSIVCLQQSHASCQAAISRTTLFTYQFKRDKLLMMMMISGIQEKKKLGHTWDCPLVEWPTPLAAIVKLVAEEDATARMSSAIS